LRCPNSSFPLTLNHFTGVETSAKSLTKMVRTYQRHLFFQEACSGKRLIYWRQPEFSLTFLDVSECQFGNKGMHFCALFPQFILSKKVSAGGRILNRRGLVFPFSSKVFLIPLIFHSLIVLDKYGAGGRISGFSVRQGVSELRVMVLAARTHLFRERFFLFRTEKGSNLRRH